MNLLDLAYGLSIGPHYLYHRLFTGKYGPATPEKTGRIPARAVPPAVASGRAEPPCLWLHAVSVGEVIAARDLADLFQKENPDWIIRVSVTTATGRSIAVKKWGEDAVFYYPLDFSGMVRRAFDRVRPTLVVLMELEIWPNFLAEAALRRIPVAVANARITDRSMRRLGLVPWLARRMAESVDAWFAQTEPYAERLRQLGVPPQRIEVTGSVKYDAVPVDIDYGLARYYRRLFGCGETFFHSGGDFLVVAGSTHPGEEKTLLEALQSVARDDTGSRRQVTVLTPRHPERLDEVEAMAGEFGRVIRRSSLMEPSDERPDIILVDTMGELAKIYSAADAVFVGGTLLPHGGQNFMEPCGLAKPTVVGPNLWNFSEPAELLKNADGIRVAAGAEELGPILRDIIAHPQAAQEMARRAREALLHERGATRRMADRLNQMAAAARQR